MINIFKINIKKLRETQSDAEFRKLLHLEIFTEIARMTFEIESFDSEDFLNSKGIWNHPFISDIDNKNNYQVADLMAEFANVWLLNLSNPNIDTICAKVRNDYSIINQIEKEKLQSDCKMWIEAVFSNNR